MKQHLKIYALCGLLLTACAAPERGENHAAEHEILLETESAAASESALPETAAAAGTSSAKTAEASAQTGKTTVRTVKTTSKQTETAVSSAGSTADAPARDSGDTAGSVSSGEGTAAPSEPKHTTAKTTASTAARTTSRTTSAAVTTAPPAVPHTPEGLLSAMSVCEKAAQMMMASAHPGTNMYEAAGRGVGAMCLFADSFSGKSAQQVRQMIAEFQTAADIPLLIAVDEEGAPINRVSLNPQLRSEPFANGRALYDTGGWDAVVQEADEKAAFLLSFGINVNLAPVCDVPLHENDYIADRAFGLEPEECAEYAEVILGEMQNYGVGTVLKHFPGYGGSVDTHKDMAYDERSYDEFTARDFIPFARGIAAGADAVLVAHNIVTCMDAEHPASLSPEVHRILREELGFDGVIITDDLGMKGLTNYSGGTNAAVAAVLAGNDLLILDDDRGAAEAVAAAVERGEIPESRLDESVLRILRWKEHLGLL